MFHHSFACEGLEYEALTYTAFDEGCFDLPLPSIEADFVHLIDAFQAALSGLPAGLLRTDFTA